MQSFFLGLAALACPVGMGLMMWMMSRGQKTSASEVSGHQQVEQLRTEIDQLKADRATQHVHPNTTCSNRAPRQPRRREELASALTVHLPAATMPRWLPSARGAVSSTGRAKDF